MTLAITDELKEVLKRIVTDDLDLSDFDVQTYPQGTGFCIRLQKPQPEPERPHKGSNILIFVFTNEFIEDKQYENPEICSIAGYEIVDKFNNFDFDNKTTNSMESPSVTKYLVLNTGQLKLLNRSTEY